MTINSAPGDLERLVDLIIDKLAPRPENAELRRQSIVAATWRKPNWRQR